MSPQRVLLKLNFQGADLTQAYLSHANLKGANFLDADCTETSLMGAYRHDD